VDNGPFPLSPGFPVLLANAVRWLAARDANPMAVNAGEPVRWHLKDQRSSVVVGPDGRTLPSAVNAGTLSFTQTSSAGVYRIDVEDVQHALVVNPVVDGESNLEESLAPVPFTTRALRQTRSVNETSRRSCCWRRCCSWRSSGDINGGRALRAGG
jgi:hypothetical protein